jgi:OOP family OmpA-OmpF porin
VSSSVAARPEDPSGTADSGAGFAELRSLIVGPEQRQLRALQRRLDDPAAHAREVSRVLPAAVELSTHDPHLRRALAPTVEEAISASVRRNPRPLADALFPIIGPAIRKAIAATLSGMLESLNTTLEHSLSWRSIRWRLDARRTGRSFAEVVLLNTLVYRVEQVFLIHRPSGLLLQHVTAPGTAAQDAAMVSAMLTAIRDFVGDSFAVTDDEGLQTLRVGEVSVWIEQGPHALLAAVIRGTAPADLRGVMQGALESVHAQYSDLLSSFAGDAAPFEAARPIVESCLQQQFRGRNRPPYRSPVFVAIVLAAVIALGAWLLVSLRDRARWNGYIAELRSEPGVVVVSAGRKGGKYVVSGLRDPLAREPSALLAAHELPVDAVVGQWQLYQALDPSLVLARARQLLVPPAGVTLGYDDGVLTASGAAPVDWLEETVRLARLLPGVSRFDPGQSIDATLRGIIADVEAAVPLFMKGSTAFAAGGERIVQEQIGRLRSLDALARLAGARFTVALTGEADADGAPAANLPLSSARAERVRGLLDAALFERLTIAATGVGSRGGRDPQAAEDSKQRNRRVSFRVAADRR